MLVGDKASREGSRQLTDSTIPHLESKTVEGIQQHYSPWPELLHIFLVQSFLRTSKPKKTCIAYFHSFLGGMAGMEGKQPRDTEF